MLPQIFNLTGLVFFSLGLMIWILLAFRNDSNRLTDVKRYLFAFFVLLAFAAVTLHNFIYPQKEVYPNTKYHALQFHGYSFENSISLINELNPDEALMDNRSGRLQAMIENGKPSLSFQDLYSPIYVKDLNTSKKANYKLKNSAEEHAFFEKVALYQLQDSVNYDLLFSLKVIEKDKWSKNKFLYVYSYKSENGEVISDTSNITTPIFIGLPLDQIFSGKQRPIQNDLNFDNALVLRSRVGSPLRKTITEFEGLNKFHFFPDISFFQQQSSVFIRCDDNEITELKNPNLYPDTLKECDLPLNFYFGLGTERSKLYTVDSTSLGWTLEFGSPEKFALVNEIPSEFQISPQKEVLQIEHFITSSAREIETFTPALDNEKFEGGYYFNHFNSENNLNHLSGKIEYFVDAPKFKLVGKITDYFANGTRLEFESKDLRVGELFKFSTLGGLNKWIFSVQDYRENNPIKIYHMIGFLLVIFLLICLRFLVFWDDGHVFRTELAIYVLVFSLIAIRIFLQWRITTFLPVDNIDFLEYNFLVNNGPTFFKQTVIATLSFFFLWLFILAVKLRRGLFTEFNNWYLIAAFLLMVIVVPLSMFSSFFERIANLFGPLLFYYALDFKLDKIDNDALIQTPKKKRNKWSWGEIKNQLNKHWTQNLNGINLQVLNPVGLSLDSIVLKLLLFPFIFLLTFGTVLLSLTKGILFYIHNLLSNLGVKFLIKLDKWFFKPLGGDVIADKQYLRGFLILFTFAFLFIMDSGYAIMFGMFIVIHRVILNFVVRRDTFFLRFPFRRKDSRWINTYLVYLLALTGFVLFYYFQNKVIYWLLSQDGIIEGYNNFYILAWSGPLFLLLIGIWAQKNFSFLFQINNQFTNNSRRLRKLIIHFNYKTFGYLILLFVSITLLSWPGTNDKVNEVITSKTSYIKYRAGILDTQVDDLMFNNNFGSLAIRNIQRAAHNQWLINYYRNRGKEIDHHFDIQPTFTQGASHITQASDLVVPRYIIAEHSEWSVVGLVLCFLLLVLTYYLSARQRHNEFHFTLLGIPLLLFMTAAFVWLTATNRFTFFGQDFPLLPVASKITLLLTFFLFLILLASHNANKERTRLIPKIVTSARSKKRLLYYLVPLPIFVAIFLLPRHSENAKNTEKYDITQVINRSEKHLSLLNQEFLKYQNEVERNTTLDSLLLKFHKLDKDLNIRSNPITSDYLSDNESDSKFINSAYNYFIKNLNEAEKRDKNSFIHIRQRNGKEHLTLNRQYFFIKSPNPELDEILWDKNLLAAKVKLQGSIINNRGTSLDRQVVRTNFPISNLMPNINFETYNHFQNIRLAIIPRTWTKNSRRAYLIRMKNDGLEPNNRANFKVSNTFFQYNTSNHPNVLPKETIVLKENDIIKLTSARNYNINLRLITEGRNVLAENLWINGHRQLFYPLGKSFIWSYNYANLIKSNRNRSLVQDSDQRINIDERVSIDYNLTRKVYQWMEEKTAPPSEAISNNLIGFRNLPLEDKRIGDQLFRLRNNQIALVNPDNTLYNTIISQINNQIEENLETGLNAFQLNNLINDCINEALKAEFDMSIVAVDGMGRIRLMVDYNQNAKVDPNNILQYNQFLSNLYASSNNTLEREHFGNINLLKSRIGLGSSFKPFVYASVISQAKLPWSNLRVESTSIARKNAIREINTNVERRFRKPELKYFGGHKFPRNIFWTNIGSDYNNDGLKSNHYLTKSNNIYHGTIFLLGSFSINDLRNEETLYSSILKKPRWSDSRLDSARYEFPRFNFGRSSYCFNKWPEDFGIDDSALANGLYQNFNLTTSNAQSRAPYNPILEFNPFNENENNEDFDKGINHFNEHFYWSFPERSDFLQSDRQSLPRERKGFINPAVGGAPVLVTPVKMAEMGIRLFNLNSNFTIDIQDQNNVSDYTFFGIDPDYGEEELFELYKRVVYDPLHRTLQPGGTASGLRNFQNQYENNNQYWFYAKTGTTGISARDTEDEKKRYKRLLIIISNQPIHNSDFDLLQRSNYKLFAVYIMIDNINFHDVSTEERENRVTKFDILFGRTWGELDDLLEEIIASETFQEYMN